MAVATTAGVTHPLLYNPAHLREVIRHRPVVAAEAPEAAVAVAAAVVVVVDQADHPVVPDKF